MSSPFPDDWEYLTQTQLGQLLGVSAVVVGGWLAHAGLRTSKGPTQKATESGIARQFTPGDGRNPFWVWERDRCLGVFEALGHARPDAEVPAPPTLIGPFTTRSNGGDGHEIEDANGVVAIWCRGQALAERLVKLLDLCHRHGIPLG